MGRPAQGGRGGGSASQTTPGGGDGAQRRRAPAGVKNVMAIKYGRHNTTSPRPPATGAVCGKGRLGGLGWWAAVGRARLGVVALGPEQLVVALGEFLAEDKAANDSFSLALSS